MLRLRTLFRNTTQVTLSAKKERQQCLQTFNIVHLVFDGLCISDDFEVRCPLVDMKVPTFPALLSGLVCSVAFATNSRNRLEGT